MHVWHFLHAVQAHKAINTTGKAKRPLFEISFISQTY